MMSFPGLAAWSHVPSGESLCLVPYSIHKGSLSRGRGSLYRGFCLGGSLSEGLCPGGLYAVDPSPTETPSCMVKSGW